MATFYSNHLATAAAPSTRAPQQMNVYESGGRVRFKRFEIELPDSANADTVRFGSFKSTDAIIDMRIFYDDLGTAGTLDIGLAYAGSANDGTEIDDNLFADALDVATAAVVAGTQIAYGEGSSGLATDVSLFGKRLWQAAGLSSDPGGLFDLMGKTDTGTTAAGTVVIFVMYVSGD